MTTLDTHLKNSLEFPYTRTTGPVIGPFLTGLRDGKVLGIRCGDRVLCPPLEYDPDTSAALAVDLVEVGPGGVVTSWTWVAEPTTKHPFDHPFAFAQIRLDGADTTLLHAIDAGAETAMATGMRVRAQYRTGDDARHGAITDVYFVPEADAVEQAIEPGEEPVTLTEHLISLVIEEDMHPHRQRFAQGLLDGKIIGQRSPVTGKVFVPGRGFDNMSRVRMDATCDVELPSVGTVSSFTQITPVQYYGQKETEPYIRCSILLDGADQPLIGIDIRDIAAEDFRVGMRLRCVWKPAGERQVVEIDNRYGGMEEGVYKTWEPTGEPDVPADELKEQSW